MYFCLLTKDQQQPKHSLRFHRSYFNGQLETRKLTIAILNSPHHIYALDSCLQLQHIQNHQIFVNNELAQNCSEIEFGWVLLGISWKISGFNIDLCKFNPNLTWALYPHSLVGSGWTELIDVKSRLLFQKVLSTNSWQQLVSNNGVWVAAPLDYLTSY